MLNWWREKRRAKVRAEVERIAARAVDLANAAEKDWADKTLRFWSVALSDSFDERLTQIEDSAELPFYEAADIEALALLKNWIEKKGDVVQEIAQYIDPEAWECLTVVGVAETYIERLHDRFDEAGQELAEDLTSAIEEEARRRGITK